MRRIVVLGIAAATALSACGGEAGGNDSASSSAPDASLPPSTSAAPTSSAAPTGPPRSQRGNIVKAVGEEGGIGFADGREGRAFSFTVDAIRVDLPCNSGFADTPANGHYIGIDVRAATAADLPPDWYLQINSDYFEVIGPDGLTVDSVGGNGWSCLREQDSFYLNQLGSGQQYAGTVVIDSPVDSGTLVYTPPGENTGWEWEF